MGGMRGMLIAFVLFLPAAAAADLPVAVVVRGQVEDEPLRTIAAQAREVVRVSRLHAPRPDLRLVERPGELFEQRHSRVPRTLSPAEAADMEKVLNDISVARGRRAWDRVAALASQAVTIAERVPEQRPDALGATCIAGLDGVVAGHGGADGPTSDVRRYCYGLAWLVTSPQGTPLVHHPDIDRHVRAYDLDIRGANGAPLVLQGVPLPAPQYRVRTLPGTRLALTVECAGGARVWMLEAADKPNLTLDVDCDFASAVHVDDGELVLTSTTTEAESHAWQLAKALGAQVLLVDRVEAEFRLTLVGPDSADAVTVPLTASSVDVHQAVTGLLHADEPGAAVLVDSLGDAAITLAHEVSPPPRARPWRRRLAAVLISTGAAGMVASWAVYGRRARLGADLVGDLTAAPGSSDQRYRQWLDLRAPMLGGGVTGATLSSLGLALLAPRLPSWVVATFTGLGAAVAAWGVVDISRGGVCDAAGLPGCTDQAQRRDRGALLLLSGLPWIVMPIGRVAAGDRAMELRTSGTSVRVAW